ATPRRLFGCNHAIDGAEPHAAILGGDNQVHQADFVGLTQNLFRELLGTVVLRCHGANDLGRELVGRFLKLSLLVGKCETDRIGGGACGAHAFSPWDDGALARRPSTMTLDNCSALSLRS